MTRLAACNEPWGARRWWGWSAAAILTLVLLGLVVGWNGGAIARAPHWPAHQAAFLAMNGAFAAMPHALSYGLTLLGDTTVLMPLMAPLLLRRPQAWAALLASVPAGTLFSMMGKHWAQVPRPGAILDHAQFTVIGPLLQLNSFPSGHSITAFAAAAAVLATLAPSPRRAHEWLLLAAGLLSALAISLSRIAVGAHWPLDLVAGAAGGWLAGLSGAALARRTGWWQWLLLGRGHRAASAGLAMWGLLLLLRPHESMACVAILRLAAFCAIGAATGLLIGGASRAAPARAPTGSTSADALPGSGRGANRVEAR